MINETNTDVQKGVRRRMLQVVITILIEAAALFVSAGTLNWPAAWVLLGLAVAFVLFNALVIVPRDPEMIAERGRIDTDAKPYDRPLAGLMSAWLPLAIWIVAGLDRRFAWTGPQRWGWALAGALLYAIGAALWGWAMASNRFFSGIVRIQSERGHMVQEGGPYAIVRHPGYLGFVLFDIGWPLLLGSWWAAIPAALAIIVVVIRTALEDRTLREELPGYADFAQRTRYRLLPGIW